jgi:tRNA(Ile)-lysidine synthase
MTAGTGLGWQLESALLEEELPQPAELTDDNLTALFDLDALRTVGPLRWRTRQPGDYIEPLGMRGRKSLQDVMVDAKIPREQRDHLPVLTVESTGEALWVPGKGGRRSKRAAVSARSQRVVMVKWRRI